MKKIEIVTQNNTLYDMACAFAKREYEDKLDFILTDFPEIFCVITDGNTIVGCMGLNADLHFPPFTHDPEFAKKIKKYQSTGCVGEQSVLAVHHYPVALPILIATIASYAHQINIQYIAYAAIPVSQKTINAIGFITHQQGPVLPRCFPFHTRKLYEKWFSLNPITYILETKNANVIQGSILKRFSKRIKLGTSFPQTNQQDRHVA